MSWWEARRLAVAIAVIDTLAAVVVLATCAAFGQLSAGAFGTGLFVAGVLMALAAATVGGGAMPTHLPRSTDTFNAYQRTVENEMLAGQATSSMVAYQIEQFRQMSWVLVFGLACVPLLVVGGWLAVAYG